jgi:hypothetical protein
MVSFTPFGPTHFAKISGSVCARTSCAGVAANSRLIVIDGMFPAASMVVVPSAVVVVELMMPCPS